MYYVSGDKKQAVKLKSLHRYRDSYKKNAIICCNVELIGNRNNLQLSEKLSNSHFQVIDSQLKSIISVSVVQYTESIYTTIEALTSMKIIQSRILFHLDPLKKLWLYDMENIILQKIESHITLEFAIVDHIQIPETYHTLPIISTNIKLDSKNKKIETLGIKNSTIINVDRYRYQRKKNTIKQLYNVSTSPPYNDHRINLSTHINHIRSQSINILGTTFRSTKSTVLVPLKQIINFEQMQHIKKLLDMNETETRNAHTHTNTENDLKKDLVHVNGLQMNQCAARVLHTKKQQAGLIDSSVSTNEYGLRDHFINNGIANAGSTINAENTRIMKKSRMNKNLQNTYINFSKLLT